MNGTETNSHGNSVHVWIVNVSRLIRHLGQYFWSKEKRVGLCRYHNSVSVLSMERSIGMMRRVDSHWRMGDNIPL